MSSAAFLIVPVRAAASNARTMMSGGILPRFGETGWGSLVGR
jgi:hypothetical protein